MGRIKASELYKIQKEDLLAALEFYQSGARDHSFAESSRFDLLVDGHRRFPPKAIVGLAAERPIGRILTPDDLTGGESSPAFRLLLNRGFEIATKRWSIERLDATFSVGQNDESLFLLWESRGPDRNVDYLVGLESLLTSLRKLDATISSVVVESAATRAIPVGLRTVQVESFPNPIQMHRVIDIPQFRQELTATIARTARGQAAGGGGNPTKRLRILMDTPEELTLYELAQFISGNDSPYVRHSAGFSFSLSAPSPNSESLTRQSVESTVVRRMHVDMQNKLYAVMVEEYGVANVSCEQVMACGRPADLVVRTDSVFAIYEIKTARSSRECVRQAFGQLIEYAFWPGSPPCKEIWIVGPSAEDDETAEYLSFIRSQFSMPIRYMHLSWDNDAE